MVKTYKAQRGQLMDQIARIYAQHFTSDELQQIVTFYSSPTGQKLASTNFDINQQLQKVMQPLPDQSYHRVLCQGAGRAESQGRRALGILTSVMQWKASLDAGPLLM